MQGKTGAAHNRPGRRYGDRGTGAKARRNQYAAASAYTSATHAAHIGRLQPQYTIRRHSPKPQTHGNGGLQPINRAENWNSAPKTITLTRIYILNVRPITTQQFMKTPRSILTTAIMTITVSALCACRDKSDAQQQEQAQTEKPWGRPLRRNQGSAI